MPSSDPVSSYRPGVYPSERRSVMKMLEMSMLLSLVLISPADAEGTVTHTVLAEYGATTM
jgi:hypothetical protein